VERDDQRGAHIETDGAGKGLGFGKPVRGRMQRRPPGTVATAVETAALRRYRHEHQRPHRPAGLLGWHFWLRRNFAVLT
jgi:hypothetical protein